MRPTVQGNSALIAGVGAYTPPLTNLPAVVNDVAEMANLLRSGAGCFDRTLVLSNQNATRDGILLKLASTLGASPQTTVFVYFVGHGAIEGDEYYFLPNDAAIGQLRDTAIPLAELRRQFEASSSERAFMWLDFCHSGGIIPRCGTRDQTDKAVLIERSLRITSGQGKVIIAACSEDQSALEDSEHGLFTRALIRGLHGAAVSNGEVTAASLYDFIDRAMGNEVQRPMLFGRMQGRIVLMHYPRSGQAIDDDPRQQSSADTHDTNGRLSDSGAWVMLGNYFIESNKVTRSVDNAIVVEVLSTSDELDATIQDLSPGQFNSRHTIPFAYRSDASIVRVDGVTSQSAACGQLWSITLKVLEAQSANTADCTFSIGNRQFTPNDQAELRARRILLNEIGDVGETGVLGSMLSHNVEEIPCAIQEVFRSLRGSKKAWREKARLRAVSTLKNTATVDRVLELSIEQLSDNEAHVRFRGRRSAAYSGHAPHEISVDGICVL